MQDKRPICAIATAPGQGAIGVVRVSAPEGGIIEAIAREVLGASLSGAAPNMPPGSGKTVGISQTVSGMAVTSVVAHRPLKPRHASYGPFLAEGGQPIDYGLALWFPAPHSYTGEHIFELQGHGGPVVQQILLRRVLQVGQAHGIRLAEPGEFTERAFLNDKLDLVQAEAVADLIEASTEQAARSATRSLQGVFSSQIDDLAEQLLTLRMLVEATLDFPEEEIDFLQKADAAGRLDSIDQTLQQLFRTARSGARLRQGLNVVLTGAPNVGKSSLLNALAGTDVAIVTPIAGTTRDRVIEQISIEGVPINLIDTAGLRETDDPVERIGIQRTWTEIEKADVVVHLRAADEVFPARETGADVQGGNADYPCVTAETGQVSESGEIVLPAPAPASAGSTTDTVADLEQVIDARVPASAARLTVINKIDLVPAGVAASAGVKGESAHTDGQQNQGVMRLDNPSTGNEIDARVTSPSLAAGVQSVLVSGDTAKGDATAPAQRETLCLSAKTGQGIDAFRQKLLDIAGFQPGQEGVFIARERHLQALSEALQHLQNARHHVALGDQSLDLFAEELRLAHQALGRITGAVTADELLGVIFSRFCIGK
ncbi:tRNA modification GTPase [Lautropia dentalis]|uniref:tRNA modification GTPase MnmE n=1 Tax=Lautropia dentalis TaxID=2490857 RepID=A0A3R8LLY1_9BURK|nr:tRNA modification GTPase [Lautropia dentalis]RRN43754.1 tRNA modification GTPase [Lautropia dentalis]